MKPPCLVLTVSHLYLFETLSAHVSSLRSNHAWLWQYTPNSTTNCLLLMTLICAVKFPSIFNQQLPVSVSFVPQTARMFLQKVDTLMKEIVPLHFEQIAWSSSDPL